MTKERFIQNFKSSLVASVQRDLLTETVLDWMKLSPDQKEDYWDKKSTELAEKAHQQRIETQIKH